MKPDRLLRIPTVLLQNDPAHFHGRWTAPELAENLKSTATPLSLLPVSYSTILNGGVQAAVRHFTENEFENETAALKWIRWINERPGKRPDADRLLIMFAIQLNQTGECIGRVYIHSKIEPSGDYPVMDHSHMHTHEKQTHEHPHTPDIHHSHSH